jgi:hypothetical protein
MGLFKGMIGFLNKVTDKLFGTTHIFIIFLGWFLTITGILMSWNPEKARQSLLGRGFGLIKGYILMLAMFLGAMLISAIHKLNGLWALVILIAGAIFLIKGYLFLKKTAAEKIDQWLKKVPLHFLRGYAVIQAIIGIVMLVFQKRIFF